MDFMRMQQKRTLHRHARECCIFSQGSCNLVTGV